MVFHLLFVLALENCLQERLLEDLIDAIFACCSLNLRFVVVAHDNEMRNLVLFRGLQKDLSCGRTSVHWNANQRRVSRGWEA